MVIIGLTGGSGAGKGEAGRVLREAGAAVIDTDAVYYRLLSEDAGLLSELRARFPSAFSADGALDRRALGRVVFADAGALADLNGIAHRYVLADTSGELDRLRARGVPAAVLDAPALFESGADRLCDTVIGVLAPAGLRAGRIVVRDGITPDYARLRISSQKDDAFYRAHCEYLLCNEGSLGALRDDTLRIYREILAKYAR